MTGARIGSQCAGGVRFNLGYRITLIVGKEVVVAEVWLGNLATKPIRFIFTCRRTFAGMALRALLGKDDRASRHDRLVFRDVLLAARRILKTKRFQPREELR